MKIQNLIAPRRYEAPANCQAESHSWLLHGGYMKPVAAGLFSYYPMLKKVMRKVERIIQEEMDAIGGQEVEMPYVVPASLWEESGRYQTIGEEMGRFKDRSGTPMVLSMTHEEAAVHLVRNYMRSYQQYPFMFYQTQTRFRDEPRPKAGLIRTREFAMNDAYSFHTSEEDMYDYYEKYLSAYRNVFDRVGLPQVVAVKSDPGMMGGKLSHEWMLPTDAGEDSIVVCDACGSKWNTDVAECVHDDKQYGTPGELTWVETPEIHSADDVCTQLNWAKEATCKSVVYQREDDGRYVVLFIRADLEVNEAKLVKQLGCEVRSAEITVDSGLHAGYIGPVGLDADCIVLFDRSLEHQAGLLCGANKEGFHYVGLDMDRDVPGAEYHDLAKIVDGMKCPHCGKHGVKVKRTLELAHSFCFGDRYTKSMNMRYMDENGHKHYPYEASCGVGIGRLVSGIVEAHHDDNGVIWPMSVAPYQVHICAVFSQVWGDEVKTRADRLYRQLQDLGVDVIYDDRRMNVGAMLTDADLIGAPLKVIIGPRHLKRGMKIELTARDGSIEDLVPADDVLDHVMGALFSMGWHSPRHV